MARGSEARSPDKNKDAGALRGRRSWGAAPGPPRIRGRYIPCLSFPDSQQPKAGSRGLAELLLPTMKVGDGGAVPRGDGWWRGGAGRVSTALSCALQFTHDRDRTEHRLVRPHSHL